MYCVVAVSGQFLFSCNSARYYEFSAGRTAAQPAVAKVAPAVEIPAPALPEEMAVASNGFVAPAPAPVRPAIPAARAATASAAATGTLAVTAGELARPEMTKQQKKELRQLVKQQKKDIKAALKMQGANILEVVLSFLLPPLAVFLHDGIGTYFWLSLILTLLFWIPGVIFALLVVTDAI